MILSNGFKRSHFLKERGKESRKKIDEGKKMREENENDEMTKMIQRGERERGENGEGEKKKEKKTADINSE